MTIYIISSTIRIENIQNINAMYIVLIACRGCFVVTFSVDVYLNGMNMRFYLKTSWNVRVSLKHNITLNNQIEVGKQFTRWFTILKTIVFNVC